MFTNTSEQSNMSSMDNISESNQYLLMPKHESHLNTSESELNSNISESAQKVNAYIEKRNADKKNLMDKLNKQEMVNIIFRQNDIIAQQSSQMLEIIDMANVIEQAARSDEISKCDVVKAQKTNCSKIAILQNHHMKNYVRSVKIQIMLFILFIIMILWLLYYYSSTEK